MNPCPKCGKPMEEAPKFPGLWQCPDYKWPINDRPLYRFKCCGMEITPQGYADIEAEIMKLIIQSN